MASCNITELYKDVSEANASNIHERYARLHSNRKTAEQLGMWFIPDGAGIEHVSVRVVYYEYAAHVKDVYRRIGRCVTDEKRDDLLEAIVELNMQCVIVRERCLYPRIEQ